MNTISLQKHSLLSPFSIVPPPGGRLCNILLVSFFLLFTTFGIAQAPEQFSCQGVVRDASNSLISNATLGVQITIRQGSVSGANVYRETHEPVTNEAGLYSFEIGSGEVVNGSLSAIDWEMGPFFIEQAIDLAGGTNYGLMSTTELLSVPYAKYAKTVDRAAHVTMADTAASVGSAGLFGIAIGTVMIYGGDGTNLPNGWLLCNGSTFDQSTYPALFNLIGNTYGTAPSGQFRVPDFKGRGPMGQDASQTEFDALGQTGGFKTHTLQLNELPLHDHGDTDLDGRHRHNVGSRGFIYNTNLLGEDGGPGGNGSSSDFQSTRSAGSHPHSIGTQGGGGAHNNLQPYYTLNFIIKAN